MMQQSQHANFEQDDGETIRTPIEGLLANEVRAIRVALDALPDSARCRELRGRLETYERAFDGRKHLGLRQAQRWALVELVFELREQTAALRDGAPLPLARGRAQTGLQVESHFGSRGSR